MTAYMDRKDLTNRDIPAERRRQITDNVRTVLDTIAAAEQQSGRPEGAVRLLAAVKTRDAGEIMAAVDAGVPMIGENRPQEAVAVGGILAEEFSRRGIAVPFHLIGQLQSNKINKILPYVDTVESVDSAKLAGKLSTRAAAAQKHLDIFLEVNVSGEVSKSGCAPERAQDIAGEIAGLPGLALVGLMAVGAHVDDRAQVSRGYERLRALRDAVAASGSEGTETCTQLSMGMSGDYQLAIAAGATVVRLGTAIFGKRAYK